MNISICVSISPKTVNEALSFVERAERHKADLIEARLDNFKDYDKLSDIANCGKVPMIATNRSTKDHGNFSGSEAERQQTLAIAADNGFEYVDIELSSPNRQSIIKSLKELGVKPIVSYHDFKKTVSIPRMNRILEEEVASGADICKIVTTARVVEDNLTVLEFVSKSCKRAKMVSFAMAELGRPSRLLSPLFGAYFTIASLEKRRETALGQLTIQQMRVIYRNMRLM